MVGQEVVARAESSVGRKRSPEVMRFLRSTLSATMLGDRVTADFYARCGFRFLSVPASVRKQELALVCQQFRSRVRLDAARMRSQAIRTISDDHLDTEAITTAVAKLENPHGRFFAELFWPHANGPDFESLRNAGRLGSSSLVQAWSSNGAGRPTHAERIHLLALAHHCMAIESECDFLDGGPATLMKQWESAIQYWRELYTNEDFWRYMAGRVEAWDDPRLRKEDVSVAREELPRIVLGFQEVLAERYADAGRYQECVGHLSLISESGFPVPIVQAATSNAVKRITGAKLDSLLLNLPEKMRKITDSVDRNHLEPVLGPLLAETNSIRELLADRLRLSESMLVQPAFDTVAEALMEAAKEKLKYDSDERERNLLYRAFFARRLMQLPLSSTVRRRIEQAIQDVDRLLYSHFGVDPLPKALDCFFLAGGEASPEDSILVKAYRVTERKLNVDHSRLSASVSLSWEIGRLLIPRSTVAKSAHGREAEVTIPLSDYTSQQKAAAEHIKVIERENQAKQADLRTRCESEIRTAMHAMRADVEKQFSEGVRQAEAAIASTSQQEQAALEQETQWSKTEKRRIDAAHAPALHAMREKQKRISRSLAGLAGIAKVELLAAIVLSLVFVRQANNVIWLAIGTVLVGQFVRFLIRSGGKRPQRAYDSAVAAFKRDQESRARAIRERYANEKKASQLKIDSLKVERAESQKAIDSKAAGLRHRCDEQIARVIKEHQDQIQPFQAKLVRKAPVKNEHQKRQFPAYVAALSKGFKEGSEPSQEEWKLTPVEIGRARDILRKGRY